MGHLTEVPRGIYVSEVGYTTNALIDRKSEYFFGFSCKVTEIDLNVQSQSVWQKCHVVFMYHERTNIKSEYFLKFLIKQWNWIWKFNNNRQYRYIC